MSIHLSRKMFAKIILDFHDEKGKWYRLTTYEKEEVSENTFAEVDFDTIEEYSEIDDFLIKIQPSLVEEEMTFIQIPFAGWNENEVLDGSLKGMSTKCEDVLTSFKPEINLSRANLKFL